MERQFVLENIKCEGCEGTIRKALLKMPGVNDVTVDIDKGIVTVQGDPDPSAVASKLYSMGYPEKGNNSLLIKAKSYFSCAVGKASKKKKKF